jgi:hypothetical protein
MDAVAAAAFAAQPTGYTLSTTKVSEISWTFPTMCPHTARWLSASARGVPNHPSAERLGSTITTARPYPQVLTKVPFLLKMSMREYQHVGLDWMATMYRKRLNGILADEM